MRSQLLHLCDGKHILHMTLYSLLLPSPARGLLIAHRFFGYKYVFALYSNGVHVFGYFNFCFSLQPEQLIFTFSSWMAYSAMIEAISPVITSFVALPYIKMRSTSSRSPLISSMIEYVPVPNILLDNLRIFVILFLNPGIFLFLFLVVMMG